MSEQQAERGQRAGTGRLARLIEGRTFQSVITTLIIINAVTLGLETSETATRIAGPVLAVLDQVILWVFVGEIALRLFVYRARFFSNGWNLFDFTIVAISLLPAQSGLSILRALRILRVLRLLSVVPSLRRVVEALFSSLPGMGAIVGVLVLFFYVGAVLTTKMFGEAFPQWFGTVGGSMYTLFQIMTLESWSMGIVRPVMDAFPLAWTFFVPFIFMTSFMVLNLFIAIIVNSMNALHDQEVADAMEAEGRAHGERDVLLAELRALRTEVSSLRETLDKRG